MATHKSCQKLIDAEEGITQSDQTKDKQLITIWKCEKNLTRSMKILSACLAIVLVVLVFYHFRLFFMELDTTQKMINDLERLETEKMSVNIDNDVELGKGKVDSKPPKAIAATTEQIKVAILEENSLPSELDSFSSLDNAPRTTMAPFPILFETEDHKTPEASNGIDDVKTKVSNSTNEAENSTPENSFGWESESSEEVESENTIENVAKVNGEIDHTKIYPEMIIDNYADYDYEYSYPGYSSYYDSSEEDSEYEDKTASTFIPITTEKLEEAPKIIDDIHDVFADVLPHDALSLEFKPTDSGDIDKLNVTETPKDESSKEDDEVSFMTDFIDRYFRNLGASRLAEAHDYLEYENFWTQDTDPTFPNPGYGGVIETVLIPMSEENMSEDIPSEDSSTVEPSSTPSEKKDSEQVDEVTADPVTSSESSKDLSGMDGSNFEVLVPAICHLMYEFKDSDMDWILNQMTESQKFNVSKCLARKQEGFHETGDERFVWKRSITDESVREKVEDNQSASKAAQILVNMQRVIRQDRQFLEDEESKISNPVVKSRMENFYKKMEAVSAHIDQLQERYFAKNKLEDDYVSQEFPPQV